MTSEIHKSSDKSLSASKQTRVTNIAKINDRINAAQEKVALDVHKKHVDTLCEGRLPNWKFDDDGTLTADLERKGVMDEGTTSSANHSANMARIYSVWQAEAVNFLFALQANAGKFSGNADKINDALGMISELKPRDGFEAMLISQMVATHSSAMTMIGRLNNAEYEAPFIRYSNCSTKLMRVFNEQMKVLTRHRSAGKQTVEVKHVHVNEGGQAIVGNVTTGGGQTKNE